MTRTDPLGRYGYCPVINGTDLGWDYVVPIDLSFVDAQIDSLGRGREAAIPLLQAIQTHYRYLPDEALRRVCDRTEITPAQIAKL